MTLDKLHAHLDANGLAMSNVGSISDQTIGGVTTIATHGTGINFKVIPTYVISFVLLLANGVKVRCSREERQDLFLATLCGFGATGLVLTVQLRVESAFRLREVNEIVTFSNAISSLDALVTSSEHVRLWWFPSVDEVVVGSFDRVKEVSNPLVR
jgi:L-gulonolactone oxidase